MGFCPTFRRPSNKTSMEARTRGSQSNGEHLPLLGPIIGGMWHSWTSPTALEMADAGSGGKRRGNRKVHFIWGDNGYPSVPWISSRFASQTWNIASLTNVRKRKMTQRTPNLTSWPDSRRVRQAYGAAHVGGEIGAHESSVIGRPGPHHLTVVDTCYAKT
jgi:hypothetical protein